MNYIAILGRQPELGIAELEKLYGAGSISHINHEAVFVSQEVDFPRLGATVKFGKHLETIPSKGIQQDIQAALPLITDARKHRQGKLHLGVSVYGKRTSPSQISRAALSLKKKLRTKGLSVRLIPNKHQDLNAAQVLNNKLTKANGFELLLIYDQNKVHIAKNLHVQDIDEYARRDRDKPVRDPLVGMLPPKLAQTLINLCNAPTDKPILDPFCGTGTVLMEAHAMGYEAHGSDISPEMVDAARVNMEWFTSGKKKPSYSVEMADACMHEWPQEIGAVAGETYLGPALRSLPEKKVLKRVIQEVDDIHRRFLQNLAPQLAPGTPVVLAVPAWYQNREFIDLPTLDYLEKLGYNLASFVHIKRDLVYHRPQQVVGRRILVMRRK